MSANYRIAMAGALLVSVQACSQAPSNVVTGAFKSGEISFQPNHVFAARLPGEQPGGPDRTCVIVSAKAVDLEKIKKSADPCIRAPDLVGQPRVVIWLDRDQVTYLSADIDYSNFGITEPFRANCGINSETHVQCSIKTDKPVISPAGEWSMDLTFDVAVAPRKQIKIN